MIRWVLWVVGGLVLGCIVHLVSIVWVPFTATRDAYSRLAVITPVNGFRLLPVPTPAESILPFMDPAFATAVCRYDLSKGPVKLSVPLSRFYTSVTFYSRYDIAYYAINDRAGRGAIELDLMTTKQRAEVPEDEEVTAADRLIVESPTVTGLIVARAFGPEPSLLPYATVALTGAQCKSQ
jgi:uncharacterized membrane protein